MAAEVVGELGRIKFAARRAGSLRLAAMPEPLQQLSALMQRLEACGMVPVLDDSLVGGNCALVAGSAGPGLLAALAGGSCSSGSSSGGGLTPVHSSILISRSGKQPHAPLQPPDWVLLTHFDAAQWAAEFLSVGEDVRPSSDAPLHAAALGPQACQRYGWAAAPTVAVHGHALAEGAGLEKARQAGLPVSEQETLFSTPEDLAALEALFRSHPFPAHRCFIRRGHGFLLLAANVAEAEKYFEQHILPLSSAQQQRTPAG